MEYNGAATESSRNANAVILNPAELFSTNQIKLTSDDQKHKNADQTANRRSSRRRSEAPSVILEVNMIPNPFLDEELDLSKTPPPCWRRYFGIFLALMASIVFSMTTLLVKVLSNHYHPVNIAVWRFMGIMLPGIVLISHQRIFVEKSSVFESVLPISSPGKKKTIFLLFIRSVTGCLAILFQFYALKFITVADASVICFSTPIMITILAYFILHEAFSIVQMTLSFVSLIGVFIIARPPFLTGAEEFDMNTLLGTGLALGSMCFTTIVFIMLRFLRESHYLLITVMFGIWGSLHCIVMAVVMGVFVLPQGLTDWSLAISLALLTFLGQTFITLALKYEQSGIVSLVRCLDVVFAFIYQFIFLGVYPDLYSVAGAVLVVLSVVIIGFRKWVYELPEDHRIRRLLRLILY